MLEKVKSLLKEKQGEESMFDDLKYVCQGGSHSAGTDDHTSDFDFRALVTLNEDYILGLKHFEHVKYTSGKGGINQYQDVDIEIFSPNYFVQSIYQGHFIPAEMLFVDKQFVQIEDELFKPLYESRELFLSQKIAFHYGKYLDGCIKRAFLPLINVKRPDRRERIEKYSYETKDAMKFVQVSRLVIEYLKTHELNLYRKDREELISIKQGKYSKTEIQKIIEDLQVEREIAEKESTLPRRCDFQKVNDFLKNYNKYLLKNI